MISSNGKLHQGLPPGVGLIMPVLERGLDPYGSSQMTYAMHVEHIRDSGYNPQLIDPRNSVELNRAMVSDEIPILLTNRSQSKNWKTPSFGSADYRKARSKILISLQGNPPFFPGSLGFHNSIFDKKMSLFIDQDSLNYAHLCNKSGALIGQLKPSFHPIGLDDEASWRSAAEREIPILFVGTYSNPNYYRELWQNYFKEFPKVIKCIDGAAELLTSNLEMPVFPALLSAANSLKMDFKLHSKAGQIALELLARFMNNLVRERLLQVVARYPSVIISTATPRLDKIHAKCSIRNPVEFRKLLDMMKRVRCVVSSNPNHMTGAITERVSNGMRRGVVILNPPNSALLKYMDQAVGNIGPRMEKLDSWLDAAIFGDQRLNEMGHAAIEVAKKEFDRTVVYKEFLDMAFDSGTWNS